jgi:hypothetical protein
MQRLIAYPFVPQHFARIEGFRVKGTKGFTGALVALALAAIISTTAWATTVSECQATIAGLRTESEQVLITGKKSEKDRSGLIGTLDAASLTLDQAKFCDAVKKLNDFKVKVNDLTTAGRINEDPNAGVTGQQLLVDADAAIDCINQLQIQSTGTGCR